MITIWMDGGGEQSVINAKNVKMRWEGLSMRYTAPY